jgi:O-acetyl-ADP-ribose deacetylase (regulator of RNase III)
MINIINHNILNAKEDIICHQVNCYGIMGAGLAKQIKSKYPEVFYEYLKFCSNHWNKDNLLGSSFVAKAKDGKLIANLFGQKNYGTRILQTDYNALEKAFINLKNYALQFDYSIAIPYKIGCGLAGGDWDIVSKMIESIFINMDVCIYKLNK